MLSPLIGAAALPTSIDVDGASLPIRHDFRNGIRFEQLIFDSHVPEEAKVSLALGIWFDEIPPGTRIDSLIPAMLDFYRCGKVFNDTGESGAQLYSYTHDYDLIYAAFMQSYRMDLFHVDTLHWWEFRAMLSALPADCQFMRVIGYRGAKTTSKMSKEQAAHIRKMQRIYALPVNEAGGDVVIRTEEQHDKAVADMIEAKRALQREIDNA